MRSLLRWSALAAALQLFLIAAVAHSASDSKFGGSQNCSPTNVALFQAPTPSCGSTLQATVGTPLTFTVLASDADVGDIVELGVTGLPAGAQLSTALPASGNPISTDFSWTPVAGDVGQHVIVFTAFDGCAAGPTQCSFTVNVVAACSPTNVALFQAPTPSCGSTLEATVGTPLTFTVLASDADVGDIVELGVTGLPAGAQLSTALPASGNPVSTDFSWTPVAGDVGQHVIVFTAFDGCAAGPTQCSFTVNVVAACSPTNVALFQAPTPSCGSTLQATVGTPLTFTVLASDADVGDIVELGVTGLPAGAQLSTALPASGNPVSTDFSWTPVAGDVGQHVIVFTAFDGCAAGPTQCSFTVNVLDNQPPDCSAAFVADTEIWPPNGRMVPVHIQGIADPDGDPFTVHVTNVTLDEAGDGSCAARVDEDGNASVRARREGSGNGRVYHVTFVATDENGVSCEGSVDLCVPHDQGRHNECVDDGQNYHVDSACFDGDDGGCSPTNVALFQAPTPSCGSTLEATVGTPLTFTVQAGDADVGDIVELGVTGLPTGAQLSTVLPASGNPVSTDFSWMPLEGDVGSHVIVFTAFDGCAAGPTQCSFTVNVSPGKAEIDLTVTQVSAGVAQVEYTLPAEAQMSVSVYNVAGRRIATIVEGRLPAGTGSARWVVTNPSPTVYFVQLRSGDKAVTKRIFFVNR